jgi:hypothetical protein
MRSRILSRLGAVALAAALGGSAGLAPPPQISTGPARAAVAPDSVRTYEGGPELLPAGLQPLSVTKVPADLADAADSVVLRWAVPRAANVGARVVTIQRYNHWGRSHRRVVGYHLTPAQLAALFPAPRTQAASAVPAPAPAPSGASSSSGSGSVHVRGYTRRDGTYVRPHTRSRPRH